MRLKSFFLSIGIIASAAATSASALAPDFFPENSVLSTGHWVKIKVSQTGMQQITYDQLRAWGFNDPDKVTVYGFGAAMSTRDIIDDVLGGDLPQQPVVRTDNKLVFFGESNVRTGFYYQGTSLVCTTTTIRNTAADAGYYFLTDSCDPIAATTMPFDENATEVRPYHIAVDYAEEEATNPNSAGMLYYGHNIGNDETISYSFPMPDRYLTSSRGSYVAMSPVIVGTSSSKKFSITAPLTRNGESIIYSTTKSLPTSSDATVSYINCENYPLDYQMAEDITQVDFTIARNGSTEDDYAAVDLFSIYYPRYNRYDGSGQLTLNYFDLDADERVVVTEANPNLLAWNIDQASNVKPFETLYDADNATLSFTPDKAYKVSGTEQYCARFVVFDPNQEQNSVEYVGEVANQNLHAMDTPEMLIISSDLCYDQALRLANVHRTMLGQDVAVVKQQEIFTEFGSGAPSPYAYRYFAKMLYDRNPDKFKSILLFGGGSFDNRALLDKTQASFKAGALLMTYGTSSRVQSSTTSRSFTADSYFGLLGDDFTPANLYYSEMKVNVGRIPAIDVSTASSCIDKIESYLSNLPNIGVNTRALLVSDAGNSDSFTNGSEDIATAMASVDKGMTFIKAYNAIYPWTNNVAMLLREAITQSLKEGVGYFTYQGHGASTELSSQKIWNISLTNSTDYDFYPFAMMATCDVYNFDRTDNNLAESMVFKRNGGMIGVIAASRSVYEARNKVLNAAVAKAYANADEETTTGDIYRTARNQVITDNKNADISINTLAYNLCGDPALPIYAANTNITLDSVNSDSYDAGTTYHITGLANNNITGHIVKDGAIDTSFNGKVIFTLYEAPVTVTTHTSASGDSAQGIQMDETALVQATASVTNGAFSVNFTPPAQIREGDYNRATFYAIADDQRHFSKSYASNLIMQFDEQADVVSSEAPEITSLYLDSDDFNDGDEVDGSFRLYATINPGVSGIKTSTGSIGGITQVNIDDTNMIAVLGTAITTNTDGTVDISLPISDIEDGRHQLTLTTSNNIGNSASRTLSFTVINRPASASLSCDQVAAHTEAVIDLTHDFTDTPSGRLIVEDNAGNTVFSRENATFPFQWDLTNSNGDLVADGVYKAYALLNAGHQYASTDKLEIIVVQKQ